MKILSNIMLTTLIGTTLIFPLSAGELRVVNENKKVLNIKLIPEGALTEAKPKATYKIQPESYIVMRVNKNNIGNKEYFKIKGETNWAGIGNDTCDRLSIHKNYRVTFQNNTIGTTCVAEEIIDQDKSDE
jgi:hypothetical protein